MNKECIVVTKTIICLANSFRPGGSCVAGIEVANGEFGPWIRPISHRQNQAISDNEKTYADGSRLAMLDLVEISFDAHQPEDHQTENWLITEGVRWRKVGQALPDQLEGAVRPANSALWRPAQSTRSGQNDEVPAFFATRSDSSLTLVQPGQAAVEVVYNSYGDKNEVWVDFAWAGTQHKIKLTDPVQFARYNSAAGDKYDLDNPYLCISLAHVWAQRNTASKLVAGLIV